MRRGNWNRSNSKSISKKVFKQHFKIHNWFVEREREANKFFFTLSLSLSLFVCGQVAFLVRCYVICVYGEGGFSNEAAVSLSFFFF